jgi:two-component system, LuxR family, response regulator FixJ
MAAPENENQTPEAVVVVVDDDPQARRLVRALLEPLGIGVAAFASVAEFLAGYDPERPGCVVTALRLPGMGGLQLLEELRQRQATLPVIIHTEHGDVATAVRAMKLGVLDFLEKPADPQRLVEAVQRGVAMDLERRKRRRARADLDARLASLSPRERQILNHLLDGLPNKEIARRLGLSEKTVAVHRGNTLSKLGLASLVEVAHAVHSYRDGDPG